MALGYNPTCFRTGHSNWGFILGAVVSPPREVQGAVPHEAFAISLIPGFQVAFPCIIRWPNLFHFFVSFFLTI